MHNVHCTLFSHRLGLRQYNVHFATVGTADVALFIPHNQVSFSSPSQAEQFPIPLLNRLEKHFYQLGDSLMKREQDLLERLRAWVAHISGDFHPAEVKGSILYLLSLVLYPMHSSGAGCV